MQEGTTQTVSLSSTTTSDVLIEILRQGAQRMLATAIEAEAADWIEQHSHVSDENGHRQVVRNGHLPERPSNPRLLPCVIATDAPKATVHGRHAWRWYSN